MKKIQKQERPFYLSDYPAVTAITEADRKAWWESFLGKGSYNSDLVRRISSIKRYTS